MSRTSQHSTRAAVGALALAALLAAGCGDKPSGATFSTTANTTAATDAPVATTAATEVTETTTAPAPDTTAPDTSRAGEVITIGYANNEGPAFAMPEFRIGGETAIDYINANGGINGATIKVVECLDDGSPEGAINCANKFIDEKVSMYYAGIDFGTDAATPVLAAAGIPVVSTHAWTLQMVTADNTFLLHSAYGATADGPLKLFSDLGVKKVAQLLNDSADVRKAFVDETTPLATGLGLTVTPVYLPAAASPDFNAAVQAAIADGAEAITGGGTEQQCTALVQAARSAGFEGPVALDSCLEFIATLGKDAVGVYVAEDQWRSPIPDAAPQQAKDEVALYERAMTDAGHADLIPSFAIVDFSAWMELRPILAGMDGTIDAASISAALGAAHDSPGFAGPNLHCGVALWPSQPNFCRAAVMFARVEDTPNGPTAVPMSDDFFDMSTLVK